MAYNIHICKFNTDYALFIHSILTALLHMHIKNTTGATMCCVGIIPQTEVIKSKQSYSWDKTESNDFPKEINKRQIHQSHLQQY
jgi:hypothetical protein